MGVGAVVESERDGVGVAQARMEDVAFLEQGHLGVCTAPPRRGPLPPAAKVSKAPNANAIFRINHPLLAVRKPDLIYQQAPLGASRHWRSQRTFP